MWGGGEKAVSRVATNNILPKMLGFQQKKNMKYAKKWESTSNRNFLFSVRVTCVRFNKNFKVACLKN